MPIPSSARIIVEAYNLSFPGGTGIATYARTLAAGLKQVGHRPEALLDLRLPASGHDPLLTEMSLFDANADTRWPIAIGADYVGQALLDPLGVTARPVTQPKVVIDPHDRFHHHLFDGVAAVADLRGRAHRHFARYGERLAVRLHKRADILHLTAPLPIKIRRTPTVLTVHDLIPIRLPYATLDNKRDFLRVMGRLLATSARIIAVSEHTRADILAVFGKPRTPVAVTYQAYDIAETFLTMEQKWVEQLVGRVFGLDYKDYFVFVGAIEPKKNLKRLIQAHALSGSRRPLVIIGAPGWQYEEDIAAINSAAPPGPNGAAPRVRWLKYLPRQMLLSLVRGARAMLFPSLYEGFGLPVIEAMALGTAVMTSTGGALPEVAGGAAHLVDAYSVDDIAAAIRRIDQDGDHVAELAAKGLQRARLFSPESYSSRLAEAYSF